MSLKHLKQIAPTWMNTSKAIFDDKEAHEVMQSLRTQFSMCYAHEPAKMLGLPPRARLEGMSCTALAVTGGRI